jgi:excisionase family DNA binding protein
VKVTTLTDSDRRLMEQQRERLWTHEEAAAYLGIPEQTLYYMNYKGTGPRSFRVGKYRRYRRQDIDAWLEATCADR